MKLTLMIAFLPIFATCGALRGPEASASMGAEEAGHGGTEGSSGGAGNPLHAAGAADRGVERGADRRLRADRPAGAGEPRPARAGPPDEHRRLYPLSRRMIPLPRILVEAM